MGKPTSGGAGGSGGRGRAVAPEPAPPPPPPPTRNIAITGNGLNYLQSILGRTISSDEIGDMIGAPDGTRIKVESGIGAVWITAKHPSIRDMKQTLYEDDGKIVLLNDSIWLKKSAASGSGTAIITRQVEAARKLGISKIELDAVGNSRSTKYNGYYTWPRLGFNAEISNTAEIPRAIRETMREKTMLELYRTQAGRDWWRENGESSRMEFDTDPNSKSSQALAAYNEDRRKRSG